MANTISSDLSVKHLDQLVVTTTSRALAPLQAFSSIRSASPLAPTNDHTVATCTAGPVAQTNPTDWESGDVTLDKATMALSNISVSWHLTSGQIQGGADINMITRKAVQSFGQAVMAIPMALLTVANYGAVQAVASGSFMVQHFNDLLGAVPNAGRVCVLDSAYFLKVKPDFMPPGGLPVYENTVWPAGESVIGFCAAQESMVIETGVPREMPNRSGIVFQKQLQIPGLDISVLHTGWVNPGQRILWQSLDCVIGAAVVASDALQLLASA